MIRALVVGGWLLVMGTSSAADDDDVKKELAALQGTWKATAVEVDGKPLAEAEVKKLSMTPLIIKDDAYQRKDSGKLKVDPAAKPKTIDFEVADGLLKGKTSQGLYELDGDTLKLISAAPALTRPTEFKTSQGSGTVLFVYKREKPEK